MKTKTIKLAMITILFSLLTITVFSQSDSIVDVNDILNNVLTKQKKEVEKKGKEEKRIKDSLQRAMNSYLANIELQERKASDSILFLDTKSLIQSELVEKNKAIETLKDSIARIKLFLISEVPNWYQEYGVKQAISNAMKNKQKEIEETNISINMTEDTYPNAGRFFSLETEKEASLISMSDELNILKKETIKKEKLLNILNREKTKQIRLFERFKEQYEKLNPKIKENEKEQLSKNFEKYKYLVSSIKSLEKEVKQNGRLNKTDPSIRKKIKNIFKKADWEFKSPIGTNETLLRSALEQAKTLASTTD